ncbi:Histone H4 [Orchesella cincta]|uniref:Histone H4 n=1 Tax=Orchesella cincta TaxID=48709 RepID=A0A1D2N0R6_ORCCI|nr:Histone H4 [Orchesella cincta]
MGPRSTTGLGMKEARLRRIIFQDIIHGIANPAIRRSSRCGDVNCIAGPNVIRKSLHDFLSKIIRDSIHNSESSERNTITIQDVLYALKKYGRSLYGCDY